MKQTNKNILSSRYASQRMNTIFSQKTKVVLERELWIKILEYQQKEALVRIEKSVLNKYKKAIDRVDFEEIEKLERITRHDVKARIQHFNLVAGIKPKDQKIHLGLTSRDITDNVELIQLKRGLESIFSGYLHLLDIMQHTSLAYKKLQMAARTHHVPAQLTTFGRRLAMYVEPLTEHLKGLKLFINRLPFRGVRGAVGTQAEILRVFGSQKAVDLLNKKLSEEFGFSRVLVATGQIYPRVVDFEIASHLFPLAAVCSSFATTLRLWCGLGFVSEGFSKSQTGSSAMPHKQNSRSSERVVSLVKLIKSQLGALADISCEQWEEGDVSCSALRRAVLPDIFYASDGVCQTMCDILKKMVIFEKEIKRERSSLIDFLGSANLLVFLTKKGLGREQAHQIIKKYSQVVMTAKRESLQTRSLLELVAKDEDVASLGIDLKELKRATRDKKALLGLAEQQCQAVAKEAQKFIKKCKNQKAYKVEEIL